MKLNSFSEFVLLESIKNPILMKSAVKTLLQDIKKITPSIKRDNITFHDYSWMWWELDIRWLDIKVKNRLEKLLKSRQENLLKNGLIMAYKLSEQSVTRLVGDDLDFELTGEKAVEIHCFFKDLYTKRFSPPKYLYHVTKKKNRKSIKKNGLIPMEFSKGNWTFESIRLYYPPTIFASLESHGHYHGVLGDDVWRIDTTNLKNKWWEDLNFYEHENPKKEEIDYVMTFEPIPPEHLELYSE
jgi:hypothetical protein